MSDTCRLVLVRHGESEWNAAGVMQGHHGPGLTATGREQAERTAEWLAGHVQPVAIVASDLPRAVETAAPAAARFDLPVNRDARLREVDLGTWSGRTREQVAAVDPEGMAAWLRGEDIARGGGETLSQLRDRVWAVLAELVQRWAGETVLVFSHGGPIRVAAAATLGVPIEALATLVPVANCAITTLLVDGDAAQLASYNELAHLHPVA